MIVAIAWLLGCLGQNDAFEGGSPDSASETPPFAGTPPSSSSDTGVVDVLQPVYQAHRVVMAIDEYGDVDVDGVQWTWWLVDGSTAEICRADLTVTAATAEAIPIDEPGVFGSWSFVIEGGDEEPCVLEPQTIGVEIAADDPRLAKVVARQESFADLQLYSFAVQLADSAPVVHGVVTTPELLDGTAIPVEKGPLPATSYTLEPLLYLDHP